MKDKELGKNIRPVIITAVIAVLIIGILSAVIFVLSKQNTGTDEMKNKTTENIYSVDKEAIEKITVITGKETYTLSKSGSLWTMEGYEGISLSGNNAETLAKALSDISSAAAVSEGDEDISKYGLAPPTYELIITHNGKEDRFYVGDRLGDNFYFKKESDDKVYLVGYDTLYLLLSGKDAFLDKTLWSINASTVSEVLIGDVTIKKDGDSWMELSPYSMAADSDAVYSKVLTPISMLRAQEVFRRDEADFEPTMTVSVVTESGKRTLLIQKAGETYLVSTDESDYVYTMAAESMSFLNVTGFDLISRYIAPIPITEVTEVKFEQSDGRNATLSIQAPSSEAPVFYKNGAEADETNFKDFYRALMSLTFNEEGTSSAPAECAITFTKESGTVIKLEFAPVDEGNYAVRINGSGSFIIRKKAVADVFGYLDNIKTVR